MILDSLEFGLSPIIWMMEQLFYMLWSYTGSAGMGVVLLSCLVALISYPLRGWASKIENRVRVNKQIVDEKIAERTVGLKGEARFRIVESIYEENEYHPINSIALGLSFLVMLPFLLSALFMFTGGVDLVGVPFLIIIDLSRPDGLIAGMNILPCILSSVTVIDARTRFSDDKNMLMRFYVIAFVLFFLVYQLASALVIYWTISNIISMFTFLIRSSPQKLIQR